MAANPYQDVAVHKKKDKSHSESRAKNSKRTFKNSNTGTTTSKQ